MSGRGLIPALLVTALTGFAPALAQANGGLSSAPYGAPVDDQ